MNKPDAAQPENMGSENFAQAPFVISGNGTVTWDTWDEDENPNRRIARLLWSERKARGMAWDDVTIQMADQGIKWEKATYYGIEASRDEKNPVRRFSADEIVALSNIFGKPVEWWFSPQAKCPTCGQVV